MFLFKDRHDAGQRLAEALARYANNNDVIVLGLPRGGVAVAYEISKTLNVPLEILLVRKLGVPGQEELAMGAIASRDVRVFNYDIIQALQISSEEINAVIAQEEQELKRRDELYRQGREFPDLKNQIVILIDDGIATGATMRAAISALKVLQPKKIVVAVPVAARSTCDELGKMVNEVVCLAMPEPLYGIGMWYADFPQLNDEEVIKFLNERRNKDEKKISGD